MNKYATRRIFRKTVWQMNRDGMVLVPEECESFLYRGPVAEAVAILYTPNFGVPGDISRPNAPYDCETQALQSSTPFPNFGLPGVLSGGLFVPITGNGTQPYGLLVRPYPAQGANASDPLGTAVPITSGPASVLRRGYANVFCQLGNPAVGGAVYIRYQNPSGGQIVGGLEASSNGNNFAWSAAQWQGPADASGNAEIGFGNSLI